MKNNINFNDLATINQYPRKSQFEGIISNFLRLEEDNLLELRPFFLYLTFY